MIIDADYLLAMILSVRDSVSYVDLTEVKRQIEKRCPGVAVDVSSPAIRSAIAYYPEIFEGQELEISHAPNAEQYLSSKYLEHEFRNSVPVEIDKQVHEAIEASFANLPVEL